MSGTADTGRRARALKVVLLGVLALATAACTTAPGSGGGGGISAVAGATPNTVEVGYPVQFTSSGSILGTGGVPQYLWDFGDGEQSTVANPVHRYEVAGSYTAQLKITTTTGEALSNLVYIEVTPDPNPSYYVRTDSADTEVCGDKSDPCATITHAVDRAVADGIHHVRAAAGTYADPLHLEGAAESDMHISGGWNADFSDNTDSSSTIEGTGTVAPVTFEDVSDVSISGVWARGTDRTSGDAIGIHVIRAANFRVGDADPDDDGHVAETSVTSGTGPNSTAILIEASDGIVTHTTATATQSTGFMPSGAGQSTYGIRVLDSEVTIERGTAFAAQVRRGAWHPAEEELAAAQYEAAQEMTAAAGLPAYEISNHARPEARSRHNLVYWRYGDYLGLGPGAHGRLTLGEDRIATRARRKPEAWLEAVESGGTGEEERLRLTAEERAEECLMLGLRLAEGVAETRLRAVSGLDFASALDAAGLARLREAGFVTLADGVLAATPAGRQCLDAVLGALLA